MRIDLLPPFSLEWKQGYLQTHPSGRKYVCLYNTDNDRTIISYARYLMSVQIGHHIPSGYEVDHKDDDKTNDDPANLQIVTEEYNRLKEQYRYAMFEQVHLGFHCAWCETPFLLTERQVKQRLSYSKSGLAFCTKACSELYQKQTEGLDEGTILQIQQLRQLNWSGKRIATHLNINRNTVMKYW